MKPERTHKEGMKKGSIRLDAPFYHLFLCGNFLAPSAICFSSFAM